MAPRLVKSVQYRLDAAMATLAVWFMEAWTVVERGYRRPLTRLALRLKFATYPLLALAAIGWLAWDWHHERRLNAAEDRIFDTVVQWRPAWVEPRPSRRTVIVEIDDCSLHWTRAQGIGGWPWPRALHADLLDALDRAGARVVGVDIQFPDPTRATRPGTRRSTPLPMAAAVASCSRPPARNTSTPTRRCVPARYRARSRSRRTRAGLGRVSRCCRPTARR